MLSQHRDNTNIAPFCPQHLVETWGHGGSLILITFGSISRFLVLHFLKHVIRIKGLQWERGRRRGRGGGGGGERERACSSMCGTCHLPVVMLKDMCLKLVSEQCDFKTRLKFLTTHLWKKSSAKAIKIPSIKRQILKLPSIWNHLGGTRQNS